MAFIRRISSDLGHREVFLNHWIKISAMSLLGERWFKYGLIRYVMCSPYFQVCISASSIVESLITCPLLLWRHNGRDCVSNLQPRNYLLNGSFKENINVPRPVNSTHKWPVTQKMVPFDDVIMLATCHYGHTMPLTIQPDPNMRITRHR